MGIPDVAGYGGQAMMQAKDGLKDSCGIFGIYSFTKKPVSIRIYNGLIAIQHRGQDSAGITTLCNGKFLTKKAPGLVSDVFSEKDLENLKGSIGIGHVRYPTTGYSLEEDAQPFTLSNPKKGLAIVHNGNIANMGPISKILKEKGRNPTSSCDIEYVLQLDSSMALCNVEQFINPMCYLHQYFGPQWVIFQDIKLAFGLSS